jgi:hypothetical protein
VERITPKQLASIRIMSKQAGLDPELACFERYECKPEELTKRAASSFLDFLTGRTCSRGGRS